MSKGSSFRTGTAKKLIRLSDREIAEKTHQQMMEELYKSTKAVAVGKPDPLKLFKVTIPSQTIKTNFTHGKQLVVGEITDYGFIQGREIVVLATSRMRLLKACLRELGCDENGVDITVVEMKGPFEHGVVIAYNLVPGL